MSFKRAKALSRPRRYQSKKAPRLRWYAAARPRSKTGRFNQAAGATYWDSITNEASLLSWALDKPEDALMSVETLENDSLDIRTFAKESPEKILALLTHLRPEFQEMFVEYYMLDKSQCFLAKIHGCIQTRIWQTLRIIEQAVGALIVLGKEPDFYTVQQILRSTDLEQTPYGGLTDMIMYYAASQSYTVVAQKMKAPVAAVRKIFRPAIEKLIASKNIREVAVGCYLRHLTHQASLTGAGLSRSAIARLRRVKSRSFKAPARIVSPLVDFGAVSSLGDLPWAMLEISSEHRMSQIFPTLYAQGKKIFGKVPAQVFAPTDLEGNLTMGYIFARCLQPKLAYSLRQIRGITELSAIRDENDRITKVITVPNAELTPLIAKAVHGSTRVPTVRVHDFVEILTGDAKGYCGTVTRIKGVNVHVTVHFPSGRLFRVTADPTAVKPLKNLEMVDRHFWGVGQN